MPQTAIDTDYKNGFAPIAQDNIQFGQEVWIDQYQDGQFPHANPKLLGPFTKSIGNGSGRCFANARGRTFTHYPENMLVKQSDISRLAAADHIVSTFTVTVRHMSAVSAEAIKDQLQKRYEVVECVCDIQRSIIKRL